MAERRADRIGAHRTAFDSNRKKILLTQEQNSLGKILVEAQSM